MRETDAQLRRRLRREIARAAKVHDKTVASSQRSFHDWFNSKAKSAAPRVGVPPKNDVMGEIWRRLTGRR